MRTNALIAYVAAIVIVVGCTGIIVGYTAHGDLDFWSNDDSGHISYMLDGGTNSSENPSSYTYGNEVALHDATRNGYEFAGWYADQTLTTKVTSIPSTFNGDVTLYAGWSANTYSIAYVLDGGTNSPSNPTSYVCGTAVTLENASREHYDFIGWYADPALKNKISITSATYGDLTLYADWSVSTYAITYALDQGTNSSANPSVHTYGIETVFSDAARNGYTFTGWYTDPSLTTKIAGIEANADTALTVYAGWSANTYTITYVLNGGTNSTENPVSYVCGTGAALHDATRDEYIFAGWCTDQAMTTRIASVSTSSYGDLTLYADWNYLLTGHYLDYSISGTYTNGIFNKYTIAGTCSYKYLSYDSENERYYVFAKSTTSVSGSASTTNQKFYWTGGDGYTWSVVGNGTVTYNGVTKNCTVYKGVSSDGNTTETQYIGDGWIPYKITSVTSSGSVYDRSSSSYVYTLTDTDKFDTNESMNVKVYSDVGITATGSGTYKMGESVTLTATAANGTTFKGWYDADGNQLSSKSSYKFNIGIDTAIYAENGKDPDYTFDDNAASITLTAPSTVSTITWTLIGSDGSRNSASSESNTLSYTFADSDTYTVLMVGTDSDSNAYYGYYTIYVGGTYQRVLAWSFDGNSYSVTLHIKPSDLNAYANNGVSRNVGINGSDAAVRAFVTSNDQYVVDIATYIAEKTDKMSDEVKANVILALTQKITYTTDSVSRGQSEYWKYPLETIYDQCGDCEDTAILFCAIGSAMGLRTAMFILYVNTNSGHAAAGVALDDGVKLVASDKQLSYDNAGTKYYYCETTAEPSAHCYVGYDPTKTFLSSWFSLTLVNTVTIPVATS